MKYFVMAVGEFAIFGPILFLCNLEKTPIGWGLIAAGVVVGEAVLYWTT